MKIKMCKANRFFSLVLLIIGLPDAHVGGVIVE